MYFNGTKYGSLLVCCVLSLSLAAKDVKSAGHTNGLVKPLCFIENKGQVADQNNRSREDIQYSLAAPGMVLYIGNGQLHYQFKKGEIKPGQPEMVTTYRMDVLDQLKNRLTTKIIIPVKMLQKALQRVPGAVWCTKMFTRILIGFYMLKTEK